MHSQMIGAESQKVGSAPGANSPVIADPMSSQESDHCDPRCVAGSAPRCVMVCVLATGTIAYGKEQRKAE